MDAEGENVVPDPLHDSFTHLRQVYFETDPNYAARFSVPVLYDKINRVIVNNESSEILRMFGTEVRGPGLHHLLTFSKFCHFGIPESL